MKGSSRLKLKSVSYVRDKRSLIEFDANDPGMMIFVNDIGLSELPFPGLHLYFDYMTEKRTQLFIEIYVFYNLIKIPCCLLVTGIQLKIKSHLNGGVS